MNFIFQHKGLLPSIPLYAFSQFCSDSVILQTQAEFYLFSSESRFVLLDVVVQHLHHSQEMFTRIPSFPFEKVKAAFQNCSAAC